MENAAKANAANADAKSINGTKNPAHRFGTVIWQSSGSANRSICPNYSDPSDRRNGAETKKGPDFARIPYCH